MSIVQPILTTEQKLEITDYINVYRSKHQAPPLVWDDNIGQFAQYWSYYLVANNLFQHSKTQLYGENLAWMKGYGTDVMFLIKKSIDDWYNEVSLYDFNKSTFSSETGHFTCLVWKASTKFAMGISMDNNTNTVDVTMNTSPPGNVIGKFAENVLPISTPLPGPVPTPEPIPLPPPTPTPTLINKVDIINKLNNVIYAINTNAPKYNIFNMIYSIVVDINTYITTLNNAGSSANAIIVNEMYIIISNLYQVITGLKRKLPKQAVISIVQQIINKINILSI